MSETKDATKRGRPFEPGNPGGPGRMRLRQDVRDMLVEATPMAAKRVIEALDAERPVVVGNGPTATMEMVPDHDVRIKAANAIMDRIHGKPSQEVTGAEGGPLFGAFVPDMLESLKNLAKDK